MNEAHLPLVEQAAEQGVQVLCFPGSVQPALLLSQSGHQVVRRRRAGAGRPYLPDDAEAGRQAPHGDYRPVYEELKPAFTINTAAVFDADGSYLGKYHKTHIPQVAGFWKKFFFKPGQSNWPVFDTAFGKIGVYICYDRHFPEGWRALALNGAPR